jgi:hypothetical protein
VIGRARGDLLCRSDEHLAADRDGLPLRGKRDRWPDLCKHARRRASLSAQTETPDASTVASIYRCKFAADLGSRW